MKRRTFRPRRLPRTDIRRICEELLDKVPPVRELTFRGGGGRLRGRVRVEIMRLELDNSIQLDTSVFELGDPRKEAE